jgi:PmbA protein
MVSANEGVSEGVGIRVACGKKVGFASSTGLGREAVAFACDEALSVARTVDEEDKGFSGFASLSKGGKDGVMSTQLLEFKGDRLVDAADALYRDALAYDSRIVAASGEVTLNYGGFAVFNSCGGERASRGIACGGFLDTTALEGGKRKTGFDFVYERKKPDLSKIGERAARRAVDMLSSRCLGFSEKMTTVWDPLAAAQFVETAFSSSINGRSVVEGRSAFADKMGKVVGVRNLNISDLGQLPESVATSAIDAEGVPRRDTSIVEKGILVNFIFDNYYAKIYGTASTGNASRSSFSSTPGIATTTITIMPGKESLDRMIARTERGILITGIIMGMGHSNLISGDFSVVVPNPYLIEKGEVCHPLEPVTVAGNLYGSLSQITGIGSDALLTPFAYTPSLAFDGFSVSG